MLCQITFFFLAISDVVGPALGTQLVKGGGLGDKLKGLPLPGAAVACLPKAAIMTVYHPQPIAR